MGQRYAKVPWLIAQEDLQPMGDPETAVFLHESTLVGLHIKGLEGHVMLGIREDASGQPVSCAITNEIHIDTYHVQSGGPRKRVEFDHVDGGSDNGDEA